MLNRALVLPIVAALIAHPAAAQRVQHDSVGRFAVQIEADPITDEDRSFAAVADNTNATYLYWACAGQELMIQLQPQPLGAGRSLVWRFDRDAPASALALQGGRTNRVTRLPPAENHAFTARARTAGELVIRQHVDGEQHDWFFDLRGSDRALSRLACVRSLRPPVPGTARDAARLTRPRPSPYDLSAVEEHPRLLNAEEIAAGLERALPKELRAQGGSLVLRLLVREDGTVDAARAHVEQSTHPALDDIALPLVPRMRFTPSRVNGRPVRSWVSQPLAVLPES